MRRIALSLLLAGCFSEAPTDKVASTTAIAMTTGEESSSSSDAGSGSEESSSGEAPFDPHSCPEWCSHCDLVAGYILCRCGTDLDCQQETECNRPDQLEPGHCM